MIDPRLLTDIQSAEGCRLAAYKDSMGFWTIAWGHLLHPQAKDWTGHAIGQQEADALLSADIDTAAELAAKLYEWPSLDTDCRRNALTELCFEMGSKWMRFHNTRQAIKNQDWQGAHDGVLKSLWASEVHERRANRIADYLLTGTYPTEAT